MAVLAFPAAGEERRWSCSRQAGNAESRVVTRELLHRDGAQRLPCIGQAQIHAQGSLVCFTAIIFVKLSNLVAYPSV